MSTRLRSSGNEWATLSTTHTRLNVGAKPSVLRASIGCIRSIVSLVGVDNQVGRPLILAFEPDSAETIGASFSATLAPLSFVSTPVVLVSGTGSTSAVSWFSVPSIGSIALLASDGLAAVELSVFLGSKARSASSP